MAARFDSLHAVLIDMILDQAELVSALHLMSTSKSMAAHREEYLDKEASWALLLKVAQRKMHTRDFGLRETWRSSKHQALRVMVARWFDSCTFPPHAETLESAVQSKPFCPRGYEDGPPLELHEGEYEEYDFRGSVSIMYGICIEYDTLRMHMMVGRRWWFTDPWPRGNRHASQALDEDLFPLVKGSLDDEPRAPVKDKDYFDIINESDYKRAKESGAWMKYLLFDAFEEHLKRSGLDVEIPSRTGDADADKKSIMEWSPIRIQCTGYQDAAGDSVVVGIQLGSELPGLGFDTESQCGKSFFDEGYEPIVELGGDECSFVAELLGLDVDSEYFGCIWMLLYHRMKQLIAKTPNLRKWSSFYAVYNEDC